MLGLLQMAAKDSDGGLTVIVAGSIALVAVIIPLLIAVWRNHREGELRRSRDYQERVDSPPGKHLS